MMCSNTSSPGEPSSRICTRCCRGTGRLVHPAQSPHRRADGRTHQDPDVTKKADPIGCTAQGFMSSDEKELDGTASPSAPGGDFSSLEEGEISSVAKPLTRHCP